MTNDREVTEPDLNDAVTLLGGALDQRCMREVSAIGQIDQTMTGNTILRVGKLDRFTATWHQTEYVVLTPTERERLIEALVAQR